MTVTNFENDGLASWLRRQQSGAGTGRSDVNADMLSEARRVLLAALPANMLDPFSPSGPRRNEIRRVLREHIGRAKTSGGSLLISVPTDETTLDQIGENSVGWGPAQRYLDQPEVEEVKVVVNPSGEVTILVQETGASFRPVPETFADPEQPLNLALALADQASVRLDRETPQTTIPLGFQTRMHVTIPPRTAPGSTLICIRRGRAEGWTLDDSERRGLLSPEGMAILRLLVAARCSFLIVGETGSGKTALLEAIVNSWPGQPHVITIEDHTAEINVRHAIWTREMVDTSRDPLAFGRAAVEALRQTPDVIAPGEIRAKEAGAILSMLTNGISLVTTMHAKSAGQAPVGLADRAAMPGSHVYEGRRDNALADIGNNLEVVIHIGKVGATRRITALHLCDGTTVRDGQLVPVTIPIIELAYDEAGHRIERHAVTVENGLWRWNKADDPAPTLPAIVARRLETLSQRVATVAQTTQAQRQRLLEKAQRSLYAGQSDETLDTLDRAWLLGRDASVERAYMTALDTVPAIRDQAAAAARQAEGSIRDALKRRAWREAEQALKALLAKGSETSIHHPANGGWDGLKALIAAGLQRDAALHERLTTAQQLADQARWNEALEHVGAVEVSQHAPGLALLALRARRQWVAKVAPNSDALSILDETIASLEHAEGDR